ncbi:unnamed protein product [Gongylonema pulchrum]|uniref:Uncharacterized protein n=1 Tax=Gongylonema pulchrum TaxID=637853 RepID=A0A183EKZ5_9BILA|nr:unnamed protein product [Gongylonema pulchrum]
MGDSSYDEDEGRLMIDDAVLDSGHSSVAASNAEVVASATSCERTVELTTASEEGSSVPGVESHPVDPEPKPNFYCESAVPKVVQGLEKPSGASRSDEISKEEGEIDDEEEAANAQASSAHQPKNW